MEFEWVNEDRSRDSAADEGQGCSDSLEPPNCHSSVFSWKFDSASLFDYNVSATEQANLGDNCDAVY
jgi:hypothetical protein